MYNFRNRSTGEYPITSNQIRDLHKQQVSFGPTITEDVASLLGYDLIMVDEKPTYDPEIENCVVGSVVGGKQGWAVVPKPQAEIESYQRILTDGLRRAFKAQRTVAVENIKVTTTAGNTFDGDETSQTRMARAIVALQAGNIPTIDWVLADNSVIPATVAELTEAMILAGSAQAALWIQP